MQRTQKPLPWQWPLDKRQRRHLSWQSPIRLPINVNEKLRSPELDLCDPRMAAAVAAKRLSSIDLHIGEGGGSTMADMIAAPAEDPLEGLDASALVGRMREALPDDLALLELAQDHKSPELAALLDVARPTVANRLAASRARLREVA